jgi:hypothetical protein
VDELIFRPDAPLVMSTVVRAGLAALDTVVYPFLADVKVSTRYTPAASGPVRHVRVRRSGGTMVNLVEDAARIDYQVRYWTDDPLNDEAAADQLANLVASIVGASRNQIVEGVRVGKSEEFVGPGRFEDPADAEREIILFTIETRLRALGA